MEEPRRIGLQGGFTFTEPSRDNVHSIPGLGFAVVLATDNGRPVADTILVVADGSLRGGPFLDPDAAALAFARWNRFRRVAVHTIRICNGGAESELLMRGWRRRAGAPTKWRRTPP